MGAMESIKGVGKKLRLDSHHMIERFGVMMLAVTLCGVMLAVSGFSFSMEKNRKQLGEQAIYTTNFETSKTKIKGSVVGVYTSAKRDKSMVLLKFDNVTTVSADAKEYQSFLTASSLDMKQEKPNGSPDGSIYVFGTTGYIGVYLHNPQGFSSQILNLTMRAKAELVVPNSTGSQKNDIDSSFQRYDQWRIYFNPGGSKATPMSSLDAAELDPRKAYYEMVTAPAEAKVRDILDADLKKMQTSLADIDEKTNRLNTTTVGNTGVKVIAPGAMDPSTIPAPIAGDKVTGKAKVDGGKDPSTLRLESKQILSGGYDFDWRSGSVDKGYLDSITPPGMDYVSFLSKKGSEPAPQIDVSTQKMGWRFTDGQLLANVDTTQSVYATVNQNVVDLTAAYTTYFSDKKTYEVNDLAKLIQLEVELRSVSANSTHNTEKNVVLVY